MACWRNSFNSLTMVLASVLTVCLLVGSSQSALADVDFETGVKYFGLKNYNKALLYFQNAARHNPSDANALYYQASCYHYMGNLTAAQQLYVQIINNFPNSDAARYALSGLGKVNPRMAIQLSRSVGSASPSQAPSTSAPAAAAQPSLRSQLEASDSSSLPSEARIGFKRNGREMVVDARIHGQGDARAFQMFFDTGAEATVFGKNHLRDLGLRPPEGPPAGSSQGVGSSSGVPYWIMRVDLKVDNIERRNFPILVHEQLSTYPLLGQSFYKDFVYTIDPAPAGQEYAGHIHFVKRGSGSAVATAGNDASSVPFTRAGNNLLVEVEVNGHKTPMFFDTGAEDCSFSPVQLKNIGVAIPPDAAVTQRVGVGGASSARWFQLERMRLGPIEKNGIGVTVIDQGSMAFPLLGQEFFSGWQFTVDNATNRIHFLRR